MLAGSTEYDALQLTLGLVQKGAVVDAIGQTRRLLLQRFVIMIHKRGEQFPSMLIDIVPLLLNVRRFENVRDFKAIEGENCCRSQNDNCKAG